jgi:hypothetical protein
MTHSPPQPGLVGSPVALKPKSKSSSAQRPRNDGKEGISRQTGDANRRAIRQLSFRHRNYLL